MYAIIKTGGKQYRVAEGEFLKVETIDAAEGAEVVLNEVLLVSTEEGLKVGTPFVEGASVTATVTHHGRHDKVRIFATVVILRPSVWASRFSAMQ